jgi:hypothetical protein
MPILRASELIKKLEAAKAEHGDVRVMWHDGRRGLHGVLEVTFDTWDENTRKYVREDKVILIQ